MDFYGESDADIFGVILFVLAVVVGWRWLKRVNWSPGEPPARKPDPPAPPPPQPVQPLPSPKAEYAKAVSMIDGLPLPEDEREALKNAARERMVARMRDALGW